MLIASLFILVGATFFLKNIGLIPALNWNIIWPLIMIWIGVYMLLLTHKASEGWKSITRIFKKIDRIDEE